MKILHQLSTFVREAIQPVNNSPQPVNPSNSEALPGITSIQTLRGHKSSIGRVAWSPNGKLLASPSDDRTVRLWNIDTGACIHTLQGHTHNVCSVAFDSQSQMVASASQDETVRLWNSDTGRLIRILKSSLDLFGIAFDPLGRFLVCAGLGGIQVWEIASGRMLRTLEENKYSFFSSVAIDRNGQRLACGTTDGVTMLFELPSFKPLPAISSPDDSTINFVTFDFDGNTLASGGSGKTVELWDIDTGELLQTYSGHTEEVYCAAISKDGRTIASKGGDSVRLWDRETGKCAVVPSPRGGKWLPGIVFHPEHPFLAAVGSDPDVPSITERNDGVIHIWKIDANLLFK